MYTVTWQETGSCPIGYRSRQVSLNTGPTQSKGKYSAFIDKYNTCQIRIRVGIEKSFLIVCCCKSHSRLSDIPLGFVIRGVHYHRAEIGMSYDEVNQPIAIVVCQYGTITAEC